MRHDCRRDGLELDVADAMWLCSSAAAAAAVAADVAVVVVGTAIEASGRPLALQSPAVVDDDDVSMAV